MLTAFCDTVFVITAIFGSMAGLLSESPLVGELHLHGRDDALLRQEVLNDDRPLGKDV